MRASRLLAGLLGTGLALAGGAAQAAPLDTAGASQCEVTGYAKDRDPKGTNVRIAPRRRSRHRPPGATHQDLGR